MEKVVDEKVEMFEVQDMVMMLVPLPSTFRSYLSEAFGGFYRAPALSL